MKARILFVDDDPDILAGLRNRLRKHRDRWEMLFAESGEVALAILGATTVDIVVSDIRMPGMGGASFLREVEARHPAAARVVLSGQADEAYLKDTLGAADVLLSKPCPGETLLWALEKSLGAPRPPHRPSQPARYRGVLP